jgi:hypothetical protein
MELESNQQSSGERRVYSALGSPVPVPMRNLINRFIIARSLHPSFTPDNKKTAAEFSGRFA